MNHFTTDKISLELAREVADRMRKHPELIEVAHANLKRWSRLNATSGPLLRCYAEWQEILTRPIEDVCDLLCSETDQAQRLRQNSPFAGILTPPEVWAIKSRIRHATTTT